MKKIILTVVVSILAMATQAQDRGNFDPFKDRDFLFDALHIGTMLIAIYLIASFILQIFKAGMTARIKNRMLDKGTEENIVKELLQPDKKENKNFREQPERALDEVVHGGKENKDDAERGNDCT